MSNIGNPNCCCIAGRFYPWLTMETQTYGGNIDASYPQQIVRVPTVTTSIGTHQYVDCNFIMPSSLLDGCSTACYDMPAITQRTEQRVEVDDYYGCWNECNDSLCWCDIAKDSSATKHYVDLQYPSMTIHNSAWRVLGPRSGDIPVAGVGSNNPYSIGSIVNL